jgi:hypothetical protein
VPITGVSVSPGGATDSHVITLDVALDGAKRRSAKAGRYVLSVNGANLSDQAGNALDERFFTLATPTSSRASYIAQLFTDGRANAGPSVLQSATPTPRSRSFFKRRHKA